MSASAASSFIRGRMTEHPFELYGLSVVSALILSKKEGWFACIATVLLVMTCVVRAIQQPPTLATPSKEPASMPKSYPAKTMSSRSKLRVDAESFSPKSTFTASHAMAYRHMLHDAKAYRHLLTEPAAPSPPWRKPPGLADPVVPSIWTKAEGELVPAPMRNHPWKMAGSDAKPVVARDATSDLPVLKLLRRLRELEAPASFPSPDRKPAGKRIVAGVRECNRAVARGKALAVVLASDLAHQFEEPKLVALLQQADSLNIPVVKALTRADLGQTIGKEVTATVLVILDVEGAEDAFGEFLHTTDTGRRAPAVAA